MPVSNFMQLLCGSAGGLAGEILESFLVSKGWVLLSGAVKSLVANMVREGRERKDKGEIEYGEQRIVKKSKM